MVFIEVMAYTWVLRKWSQNKNASRREIGVFSHWASSDPANNLPPTAEEIDRMKQFLRQHALGTYLDIFPEERSSIDEEEEKRRRAERAERAEKQFQLQEAAIRRVAVEDYAAGRGDHYNWDWDGVILEEVQYQLDAEDFWTIWEPGRFRWWPGQLMQTVWADSAFLDHGIPIIRVHAETDLLRNVPNTFQTHWMLAKLNQQSAFSAFVFYPDAGKIKLRSNSYFEPKCTRWLINAFTHIASLQAAEAHKDLARFARQFTARPDSSPHPKSGFRQQSHAALCYISEFSAEDSAKRMEKMKQDLPLAVADFGVDPLTVLDLPHVAVLLDFPVPGCTPTALLRVSTDWQHPWLGEGLRLTLQIPKVPDQDLTDARFINHLNIAEATERTRFDGWGAWCANPVRGSVWGFSCFMPASMYASGLLKDLITSMSNRARWLASRLCPADENARVSQDGSQQESNRAERPTSTVSASPPRAETVNSAHEEKPETHEHSSVDSGGSTSGVQIVHEYICSYVSLIQTELRDQGMDPDELYGRSTALLSEITKITRSAPDAIGVMLTINLIGHELKLRLPVPEFHQALGAVWGMAASALVCGRMPQEHAQTKIEEISRKIEALESPAMLKRLGLALALDTYVKPLLQKSEMQGWPDEATKDGHSKLVQ